jgi:very-short-patch-repair endonuclease
MKEQTNKSILKPRLQRRLRNTPTDAERHLWQRLKARQLEGCKFRRQHPFRDFILDFVCLERLVIVELDGGQHSAHIASDAVRTSVLEHDGFVVLRFWNNEVFTDTDGVLERIRQQLEARAAPSPPNPPLEGEG